MSSEFRNVTVEELFESARKQFGQERVTFLRKAYEVAEREHGEQKRKSGEPFIIHPVNVAYILLELGVGIPEIAVGLLHDVVEDTPYNAKMMESDFGSEVTNLVAGVTKISRIREETRNLSANQQDKKKSREAKLAENVMKILMASAEDIRVLVIKLADKTHNMRTIQYMPPEKRIRISREVMEIYAPIAGRLGIYKLKSELEDHAFQVLFPREFNEIKSMIKVKKSQREEYIQNIQKVLLNRLHEVNIQADVQGRAKHFYSVYAKMHQKGRDFEQIYDLRALRIITKELKDCYGVLGIVHTLWVPVPGRFKDYIATPKSNLYQSLHTTVMGPDGNPIEVQIRTEEMHQTAEYGIAAHWAYKQKTSLQEEQIQLTKKWNERIRFLSQSVLDPKEFVEEFATELREDEILVFAPDGQVIGMPKGSTVLDFAFRIHTELGLRAKGARVNGKLASFRTELTSGNQIEIITDKRTVPSPIWLRILKTSSARQKLRQYFKKQQDDAKSKAYTEISSVQKAKTGLSQQELDTLKNKAAVRKRKGKYRTASVLVDGIEDILVKLAGCCAPIPGDEIIGFITKGRGVSVHRHDCPVVKNYTEKKRMVNVWWQGLDEPVPVRLEVKANDRQGIYSEIVGCIANTETNMLEAGATSPGGNVLIARFLLGIEHLDQLEEILQSIRMIPDVIHAERIMKK
ncbi:MAG: bifunctional (p)ppGpp synthetase/guanosine-3',5'-bis(diphosphate) 3'-pyrophosphohydrolase [Spirochaetota bacterium]